MMRHLTRTVIISVWIAATGSLAFAQAGACASPNAPRIGLLIKDKILAPDPTASPELIALSKRLVAADTKFRDQLAQRLSPSQCIVTDPEVFYDPKNFPQLKGTPIIEIKADASFKNPSVFALAVTVSSTEGVNARDEFRMFTIPVLIESDSDYAQGAETVMKYWQYWGEAAAHDQKK